MHPKQDVTVQNLRNSNEFEVWTLVVYDESLKPVLGPWFSDSRWFSLIILILLHYIMFGTFDSFDSATLHNVLSVDSFDSQNIT